MRSSTADITTKLLKPQILSLEESFDIISDDELIEIDVNVAYDYAYLE